MRLCTDYANVGGERLVHVSVFLPWTWHFATLFMIITLEHSSVVVLPKFYTTLDATEGSHALTSPAAAILGGIHRSFRVSRLDHRPVLV